MLLGSWEKSRYGSACSRATTSDRSPVDFTAPTPYMRRRLTMPMPLTSMK